LNIFLIAKVYSYKVDGCQMFKFNIFLYIVDDASVTAFGGFIHKL